MTYVRVKENESFESALRRFKRQCEREGILSEIRKREHFEKPSVKRKKKAIAAGMKTLREDGLEKAKLGLTTLEEVLRATEVE